MARSNAETGLYPPETLYIAGYGAAGVAVDLHATPTTAAFPIGTKAEHPDGRFFRYGMAAAAVTPGKVTSPDLSAVAIVDTDDGFNATYGTNDKTIVMDVGAYASKTLNQFSGAYLIITDDAGAGAEGGTYRIKTSTASYSTDQVDLELYEELDGTVSTDSDHGILPNMWAELVPATAATDFSPSGVSQGNFADNDFGWVITWGPTAALQDGTIAAGDDVYLSDGVAGAVQTLGGGATYASNASITLAELVAEARVGYCVIAGDDTGFAGIIAQIWP